MRSAQIRDRLRTFHRFGQYADLRGITCEDRLDLDGADLTGVDLTGARFPGGISARGATFRGLCWFQGIQARDGDFTDAVFHSDARFDNARIDGTMRMHKVECRGVLQFDGARIGGGVDLTGAVGYGNCSFAQARLSGGSCFGQSEWMGGLWLESAEFERLETGDMQVHGRLWTRRARLGGAPITPDHFSISFGYAYQ